MLCATLQTFIMIGRDPWYRWKDFEVEPLNIKVYSERDFPSYLPKMGQLYDDLFSGGKGFRSVLTQKVAGPLGVPPQTVRLLCQTIEFIHNASLLHDDLIDNSVMRRGKTAAWRKYTPEYAVLAGDYLLARVMCNLSDHGNLELIRLTSQTISELLEGEWLQDSLVGNFSLQFDQLTQVHSLKTATLFRWCLWAPFVAMGPPVSGVEPLTLELGTILGTLFQRSDDLLDFDVRNREGKAVLGDLRSGYVNSFAAFATSGWSPEDRLRLKSIEDLSGFKALVGEAEFFQKVSLFDEKNENLIALYSHHLGELEELLSGAQKQLIQNLRPLADLLYFRGEKKEPAGEA